MLITITKQEIREIQSEIRRNRLTEHETVFYKVDDFGWVEVTVKEVEKASIALDNTGATEFLIDVKVIS